MSKQLVFNLGVRFDRYATGIPAESRVASQFASAGTFSALQTGTWNEFAPRIGMVWNIFGDNKTVLRMSWGRFNHAIGRLCRRLQSRRHHYNNLSLECASGIDRFYAWPNKSFP